MQIQAINGIPFKGAETDNKDKKTENKKSTSARDDMYAYHSKHRLYETLKLTLGREKEDSEYTTNAMFASIGAVIATSLAFIKSAKSLFLHGKLNKAIKNSASSERIAELKKAALKKQKGSAVALGIGLAFMFSAVWAWSKNKFEADKTAKERGFTPDKELNQKAVQDKSTIDKALDALKTKYKETKEDKKEEIKETAENNN